MVTDDERSLARKRELHANSTPEWRRHIGNADRRWHLGNESGGSFVTHCHGRWPLTDENQLADRPPYLDRCDACERSRIDVVRIEVGLAELARNAPAHEDWPGTFDLSDIGGEA